MDRQDKIRKLAHCYYLKRKGKNPLELDDWLKAEKIIIRKERTINGLFKFIRHPLFLIIISGIFVWPLQQNYRRKEEVQKIKFEIIKKILPIHAAYYQEIWNEWYAFQNKQPSVEYRRNIQRIVVEAKDIETQIPILFQDAIIYEDWKKFMHIFWEAQYNITRDGISEPQLNEKLNSAAPLIDNILNRIHRELRQNRGILEVTLNYWKAQ